MQNFHTEMESESIGFSCWRAFVDYRSDIRTIRKATKDIRKSTRFAVDVSVLERGVAPSQSDTETDFEASFEPDGFTDYVVTSNASRG